MIKEILNGVKIMKITEFSALLILGALWGASFLFMRIASPVLGPLVLIDVRVMIAGLFLLIYALLIRRLPNLKAKWKEYLLLGAFNAAIPFTLIATSTLHLTASIAAILNATTPVFTAIVARIWLKETLTLRKLIGIPIGMVGVVILVGWSSVSLTFTVIISICFSLLAALFYGIGGVYTKRVFVGEPPLTLATGQQLGAGLLLIPFSVTNLPHQPVTFTVAIAVISLAIFSTSIGYLLYFYLIHHVGPTKTLSVTFLVPLFGVIFGVLFLHEHISVGTIIGLITIFGSTMFMNDVKLKKTVKKPLCVEGIEK